MLADFTKYSLALIKDNEIIFSSNKPRLRPLVECIYEFRDKIKGASLHDKVIGLAAARIIAYSKIISEIRTLLCSKKANKLLEKGGIRLNAEKIVDKILNNDKTDICPLEKKAMKTDDNESFYLEMVKRFI